MTPRVTAIMPTADRRPFVPAAIAQFLAQDQNDAELLILDDGIDPVADLVPAHPRIRYLRDHERRAIGTKRNRMGELAQGEIIVHWDDDDWHAPDRLRLQVAALDATGADLCGLADIPFLAEDGSGAWTYHWRGRFRWIYGASLAYRRAYWRRRPFQPLRHGEDTRFVFDARDAHVHVMPEQGWLIARIHAGNTSPKQISGSYWHPRDPAPLQALAASWTGAQPHGDVAPLANVYAVLVHERPECVVDLVRNLRWHDDRSPILLYDGSAGGTLLDPRLPWARWGVEIVTNPRPMRWGALHGFALACIAHLAGRDYDALTTVDSDQLLLRKGYPEFLGRHLGRRAFGVLSSDPRPQGRDTRVPPAQAAHAERALWQPLLDRFPNHAESFVRWSFWPATVLGAAAAQDIARLFADPMVEAILARSRLWATEEVLFPTFAALLGHPVLQNPCAGQWTQYRRAWSQPDLEQARANPAAFWMHPLPRALGHRLRREIRRHAGEYRTAPPASLRPTADEAILDRMRALPGWLEDDEARAILAAARQVCAATGPGAHLVEIGSFCGKATVLLGHTAREREAHVTAIDRFDGLCGSRDQELHRDKPTRVRFDVAMADAALQDVVSARTGEAADIALGEPVDLLLIDGWHDYPGVLADFHAVAPHLTAAAIVLFHDYAPYFPGVMALVDELAAAGDWVMTQAAGTLRVLRRADPARRPEPAEQRQAGA